MKSSGTRSVGLAVAVVVCLLCVACGPAWATTGHDFAGQFGGAGEGDGQFSEPLANGPAGVAVMASTGSVFALDQSQRVQQFSATGAFQSAFAVDSAYLPTGAIAVDSSGAGAVYVSAWLNPAGHVLKYSAAGTLAYELDVSTSGTSLTSPLTSSAPVAVDPVDGTVYAVATNAVGSPGIDSFDSATGAFIAFFDGSNGSPDDGFHCPNGLAVDASHQVYVLDACKNRVDRYDVAGAYQATVDDGTVRGVPSAVAVDQTSGEVYVSEAGPVGTQITQFTAGGGDVVYTFDASNVGGVRAMAVGGVGIVYTSDGTSPVVERFTSFDGPTVSTNAATADPTTSVLNGTINPEGVASKYHFEYGTGPAYGLRTPSVDTDVGSGSVPVLASAVADGLEPNTTYHYRIVGSNASGSIAGGDQMVTTGSVPASVDGPAFASAIRPTSVHLHATVNANNALSTSYYLEYGTTTSYGTHAATDDGGFLCSIFFFRPCDGIDRPVVATLSNLAPDTTYHFRVVADNGTGDPQQGADQVFITAPASGAGAKELTARTATLNGTLNAHGSATTYHFNYGPSSNYGAHTPEIDGGSADGDLTVSQKVADLSPSTSYHVQLVATTDGVVRTGGDGMFRTSPAPTATAAFPTGVSTSAATLAGTVNTFGVAGSYHFSVASVDRSFALSTGERALSAVDGVQQVAVPVTGLPAGESFRVQLIVASSGASEYSDQIIFATAPELRLPPALPETDPSIAFGCTAPSIDAYNARPEPGDAVRISGHDLGVGGTVVLDGRSLPPTAWSGNGFTIELPSDASGTLGLTINCGRLSNTIAIATFQQPDNTFVIVKRSINGSTVSLSVRLPGPGKVEISGTRTRAITSTITKSGLRTIKIRLTNAAIRALGMARDGKLTTKVAVRYTPAGGKVKTKTIRLTYSHRTAR